ncbi:MAG: LysM peptidoglycan-binding domain-containing protein [Anaerolineae bacterium]|nr:LysM peptidoglycan-binding domain-containing protein [Anaerolineae bacterium]
MAKNKFDTLRLAAETIRRKPHRAHAVCCLLLLWLAACSPVPTPTITPLPPTATISPALIEAAAEFCPMPRGWVIYLTQPGDSLAALARRTSSTIAELATANCLNNPRALDSGLVFYLPRQPVSR